MPVPAPNLYPHFNIVRVSHATLVVGDLQRSRAFYADVLGLQVTDEAGDVLYLRAMEERGHHSLVLRQGASPAVGALGFKLFDDQDLEKAAAFFRGRGRPVEWIDRAHQSPTLRTSSPQGIPLEFHARMDRLPPIHQQYGLYRGVRPLRIDHFNCLSPDVDEAVAFFGEIGFRVTEYTEDDATKRVVAAWMHRKGTSHDIAFMNGVGPKLHHLAFWVPGPLSIIDLLDQMATTGYVANIERGPGRHGISNAFFLYVRDPDGHRIELYCSDYQTVDPDLEPIRWSLDDPQRKTLWGTPSPPSFYEEATEFECAMQSAPELETPS
ncbi:Extradiol ring-cleavage dioxygenase:Glyoxalase/Bleomycin resistance protein/dioxygenase domain:Glyoxalase I [Mesorhizobium plurifarium]|uniref:Extradiol ring-cleavage dioxygenase:Glyoxalase/Bleomycin resistance protein/dioxygenase domain:Glyoxalase I n=1 Tax=Mesorhizobium plurifarium TaxID=69974 RepID=A0A090F1E7_MESPL|nr:Extradiol ring-cleavage dioxygenase:Glyoxalase/Bleomycin resistance protein/dioxygenase domain:Glyoxalase I [Mesorhizobium plurifarium]